MYIKVFNILEKGRFILKGLILYFSGTGNTKFIANKLCEEFIQNKCNMDIHSIEENINIKKYSYDYLIVGFPKYFEYIPEIFMEYIKDNINYSGKEIKTMIFSTGRDEIKSSFKELEDLLLEKNYKVIITKNFKMPDSHILSKKYKGVEVSDLEEIYKISINEVKNSVENFLIENYSKEKISNFKGNIIKRLSRFRTRELYKNSYKFSISSSCDKCNLCVRNCPTKNIDNIANEIKFRDNCIMCCRCISICPQNAILYKEKKYSQYKANINLIVN